MRIFVAFIFLSVLVYAEPSAFSAGDLNQDNPYGLTENEQLLLKNINKVKNLNRDKNTLYGEVQALKNDVEGLRTVIDGLSTQHQRHQKEYTKLANSVKDSMVELQSIHKTLNTHDNNLTAVFENLQALSTLQNENFENIKNTIQILDTQMTTFETNYVTKKSFEALQNELNDLKSTVLNELKRLSSSTSKPKLSGAQINAKAHQAYEAKNYKEAIELFNQSIAANYKPAGSHYYAAESYFALGNYPQAVAYFKESYSRYKKGSYNDKLFLHTGIALIKSGKKEAGKKFLKRVIDEFPNSQSAQEAKRHL